MCRVGSPPPTVLLFVPARSQYAFAQANGHLTHGSMFVHSNHFLRGCPHFQDNCSCCVSGSELVSAPLYATSFIKGMAHTRTMASSSEKVTQMWSLKDCHQTFDSIPGHAVWAALVLGLSVTRKVHYANLVIFCYFFNTARKRTELVGAFFFFFHHFSTYRSNYSWTRNTF